MGSRSLFSQLQEILSELWVAMENRRSSVLPTKRIEAALAQASDYPADDPEYFDETVEKVRASLAKGDLRELQHHLQELAELSRAGATMYR